jgi:hypothetical protein
VATRTNAEEADEKVEGGGGSEGSYGIDFLIFISPKYRVKMKA